MQKNKENKLKKSAVILILLILISSNFLFALNLAAGASGEENTYEQTMENNPALDPTGTITNAIGSEIPKAAEALKEFQTAINSYTTAKKNYDNQNKIVTQLTVPKDFQVNFYADHIPPEYNDYTTLDDVTKEIKVDANRHPIINYDRYYNDQQEKLKTDKSEFEKAITNYDDKRAKAKEAHDRDMAQSRCWKVGKTCLFQDQFDFLFTIISIARSIWITSAITNHAGTCTSETPLKGSDKCQSCNANPYMLCTKERCAILGNCIAVPAKNFSDPKITSFDPIKDINYRCIPGKCDNFGLVGLKEINASIVKADGTPFNPTTSKTLYPPAGEGSGKLMLNLGQIDYNSRIMTLTIRTDQLASCRYILDKPRSNFSDMSDFENNEYPENAAHQPVEQTAIVLLPGDLTRDSNHTIYIKCSNICGAAHNQDYDHNQVRFKFSPKPDSLPPEITFFDPQNNGVVRNDWQKLEVSLWLDENGGCAYSTILNNYTTTWENMTYMGGNDKNYSRGDNTSIIKTKCIQNKECTDLKTNKCAHCNISMDLTQGFDEINWSSLPAEYQSQIAPMGLYNTTKMFTIMLRCNDTTNNKIPEDEAVRYTIMTMPPYNISIIKPENNSQTYDPMPNIQVTSDPRLTECRYAIVPINVINSPGKSIIPIVEWNNMWAIDNTVSTIHTGKHNETLIGTNYPGKEYNIQVICQDQWGLEARDNLNFSVINDTKAPTLIRTYHDSSTGDSLVIETDEPSTCAYTFDRCNFNFSQGQIMTGNSEYIHTAYWSEKTFFIKCQDEYGNILADNRQGSTRDPSYNYCTAILKPFNIPSIG